MSREAERSIREREAPAKQSGKTQIFQWVIYVVNYSQLQCSIVVRQSLRTIAVPWEIIDSLDVLLQKIVLDQIHLKLSDLAVYSKDLTIPTVLMSCVWESKQRILYSDYQSGKRVSYGIYIAPLSMVMVIS